MLVVSALYAALSAFLIVWLSRCVIRIRRAKRVPLGDGGHPELQAAIRAQGNAVEYIPITLILLVLLELNGAHWALIHLGGMAMLAGRVAHARGLLTGHIRYRVLGMQLTFYTIIGLALVNLGFLVYGVVQRIWA